MLKQPQLGPTKRIRKVAKKMILVLQRVLNPPWMFLIKISQEFMNM
jgi:hypothetical protein